jgi:hypothetical protein
MGTSNGNVASDIRIDISIERESIVGIVSLHESKFSLYKYVKNG